MPDYALFGGCLRSDIPFPELREIPRGIATWTLRTAVEPCPARQLELVHEASAGDWRARLYRSASGHRIEFSDTGSFDISANGAELTWYPAPAAPVHQARINIVGPVLATALHFAGYVSLHASAVALHSHAVAFAAPPFHGKSTLALAMVTAGARLITDDMVPVDPAPPVTCLAGVPSIRLRDESVSHFMPDRMRSSAPVVDKHLLSDLPSDRVALEPVPLGAIYILTPVVAEPGCDAVRRTRLPPVQGAMTIIRHSRIGPILGAHESAAFFPRAAAIADAVPVYTLAIARDLDRMPEVVAQLLQWHGPAAQTRAMRAGSSPTPGDWTE
ncbi:MAG TPA: hypothetical protein VFW98_06370 [Gemmatimonadaceae bacterium]|nr:hypothetical protein [Gemmatimonadaceae bacterium]